MAYTYYFPRHSFPKKNTKKNGSVSFDYRVILSAGAMLIFSVSFQMTKCPKAKVGQCFVVI